MRTGSLFRQRCFSGFLAYLRMVSTLSLELPSKRNSAQNFLVREHSSLPQLSINHNTGFYHSGSKWFEKSAPFEKAPWPVSPCKHLPLLVTWAPEGRRSSPFPVRRTEGPEDVLANPSYVIFTGHLPDDTRYVHLPNGSLSPSLLTQFFVISQNRTQSNQSSRTPEPRHLQLSMGLCSLECGILFLRELLSNIVVAFQVDSQTSLNKIILFFYCPFSNTMPSCKFQIYH